MKIGVICDLEYTLSTCYSNYYKAICNIFKNTIRVKSINDLNEIDLLFIGNDHHQGHLDIWRNESFINKCNDLKIIVCVYTAEYIGSSMFPWNVEIQKDLQKFAHLEQRMIDVNDCKTYNKSIARGACSKDLSYVKSYSPVEKINKCVFVGKLYPQREKLIRELYSKDFEVDVFPYGVYDWDTYMKIIAQYRFVLSPYSNDSNSFHLKFYEALMVNSIPLHQVYEDTLNYYPIEAQLSDAIYFTTADELIEKVNKCYLTKSSSDIWLEDELTNFFKDIKVIQ